MMSNPYIDHLDTATKEFLLSNTIATESIHNPLSPHLSTLYKILSKFIANIRYFGSDFKRSELKSYIDSNRRSVDLYFHNRLGSIAPITVPVVPGMVNDYNTTAQMLLKLILGTNVELIYVNLSIATRYMYQLQKQSDPTTRHKLESIYHQNANLLSHYIEDTDRALHSLINPRRPVGDKLANTLYKTRSDLWKTTRPILEFDDVFRAALDNKGSAKKVFDEVDRCVKSLLEAPGLLTRDDLAYYSSIVAKTARSLELYGSILNIMQQTEHLFTIGFTNLIKRG